MRKPICLLFAVICTLSAASPATYLEGVGRTRAAVEPDAAAQCEDLFGPGARITPAGKFRYDGRVHAASFLCTAPRAFDAALIARLVGHLWLPPTRTAGRLSRLEDMAAWELGHAGEPAVDALLSELAKSPPPAVARRLTYALENTRSARWDVVRIYLRRFESSDPLERGSAAGTLRGLGQRPELDVARLIAWLLPKLESSDDDLRHDALDVLGGLGHRARALKPRLFAIAKAYPRSWAPPSAADALEDIGLEPQDLPAVREALFDRERHPFQRADFARITPQLGPAAVALLVELLETETETGRRIEDSPAREALGVLTRLGPGADGALNARVLAQAKRWNAPELIAAYEAPAKAAAARERERERDSQLSSQAGTVRATATLPQVLTALRSPEAALRWAAVDGLKRFADEQALAGIAALLAGSDAAARAGALEAVKAYGPRAVRLKRALWEMASRSPAVENGFVEWDVAVLEVGVRASDVGPLRALLASAAEAKRRGQVARVLGKLGGAARAALGDLLAHVPTDLPQWPVEAASPRVNPVDGDVYRIVLALGEIGPSGNPTLDGAVAGKMKLLAETDDFNVPAWLRQEAEKNALRFGVTIK